MELARVLAADGPQRDPEAAEHEIARAVEVGTPLGMRTWVAEAEAVRERL